MEAILRLLESFNKQRHVLGRDVDGYVATTGWTVFAEGAIEKRLCSPEGYSFIGGLDKSALTLGGLDRGLFEDIASFGEYCIPVNLGNLNRRCSALACNSKLVLDKRGLETQANSLGGH